MITKEENIRKRLRDNYSSRKVAQLYRLQRYAYGESYEDFLGYEGTADNTIVDLPDVSPDFLQIGKSRRILNHTFISMSKILYSDPKPEFKHVDPDIADVRKQFFRKRSTNNKFGESFATDIAAAYLDGDSLGLGYLQLGLVSGNSAQRIGIKHVPSHQVIWDRNEKSPKKSRFIAFIHYLTEDIAIDKYGLKVWEKYKRVRYPEEDTNDITITTLRIIEYFDLGYGEKGDPTYCVIANDFEGDILTREENPYGALLPFAHYESWTPPGCTAPIGRIIMQMSTQAALNNLEEHMNLVIERGVPFTLLDKSQIDPTDYENLNEGEDCAVVGYNPGSGAPFIRVAGAEVPSTLLQYQAYLERILNTESGLSDLDRSNSLPTVKSATEISMMQSSSQIQGAWARKQLGILYETLITKLFEIAKLYDRDPLTIDYKGEDFILNDPETPSSYIEEFLRDEGEVWVDETSLDYKDLEQEKLKKLSVLQQLAPDVQAGLIDAQAYIAEKLQILGLPMSLIKQQTPMPEMAGAPGMDIMSLLGAMPQQPQG